MKEVPQYKITYRVFDKKAQAVCVIYENLFDAILYCYKNREKHSGYWNIPAISYTLKAEPSIWLSLYCSYTRKSEFDSRPATRFVILTSLGDVVSKEEIDACYKSNYKSKYSRFTCPIWIRAQYIENSRLVFKKGSASKIKITYQQVFSGKKLFSSTGSTSVSFKAVISGYYRPVKTHGEIKAAYAHVDEYGQHLVRAKRRHNNVPNYYDDIGNDVWGTRKSWKHNSKRRKQWMPKE